MTSKGRWPTAALRERFKACEGAARVFCDIPVKDRDAGIELVHEEWERTRMVTRAKVAFFQLFGWSRARRAIGR